MLGIKDGLVLGGVGLTNSLSSAGLGFLSNWFGAEHNARLSRDAAYDSYLYQRSLNEQMRDIQKELAVHGVQLSQDQTRWTSENLPTFARAGLELAGYNPILAVNSAGGTPMSAQIPGASSSGAPHGHPSPSGSANVQSALDGMAKLAAIRQTNASTDLLERKSLAEGWTIKTLSAGEAKGLGASLLGKLGFNFNGSEHQTFLVAYNPITGELRNLGDTKNGLGTTGEPTNAQDVPHVDVEHSTGEKYRVVDPSWFDYNHRGE